MSMEPCVADRKKFDIDLQYGKVREKRVADMLQDKNCLLYTSPSPRDFEASRMPSSA